MSSIDMALLSIIVVVAIIGVSWLIIESRSDDEK